MKINGESRCLPGPSGLSELLEREGYDLTRIAVMVNGRIIAKSDLETTMVRDEDSLEVVSFVGGG